MTGVIQILSQDGAAPDRIVLSEKPDPFWLLLFSSEKRSWHHGEIQFQGLEVRLLPTKPSSLVDLQREVREAVADANLRWNNEVRGQYAKEIGRLQNWAVGLIGALVVGIAASAVLSVQLLPQAFGQNRDAQQLAWLAVSGGVLGSALAALKSALDRFAAGWEFDDGVKFPMSDLKERFLVRMVPWLLARPVLGGVMGLVVYTGVVGGFLIASDTRPGAYSAHGILFLAILGGLFAKTLWDRLLEVFKMLVGEGGRGPASGQSEAGAGKKAS